MFKKIMDLNTQKNLFEAFLLYAALFVLTILLGMFFGGFAGTLWPARAAELSTIAGGLAAATVSSGATLLLFRAKNLPMHVGHIALTIVAGLAGLFFGGVMGLIVPAFLSTRPSSTTQ